MSQVNLLPREILEKAKTRRLTVLIGIVGAVLAGLLIFIWVLLGSRLNSVNQEVASQQALNNGLSAKKASLAQYQTAVDTLHANQATLLAATQNRADWSTVLNDVSLEIPTQMWLSSLSVSLTAPVAATTGAAPAVSPTGPAVIGTVNFAATSSTYLLPVARWADRLNQAANNWSGGWVPGATFLANTLTSREYTVTASTNLLSTILLAPIKLGPNL